MTVAAAKLHLLVNLPGEFFIEPTLAPIFARLEALGEVRRTSHDRADDLLPDLQWADAVLMWSWPRLTDNVLNQCPNLRFSANLDITQAGARTLLGRGMPVSVAKRAFSPAVAEMALTLILSTLRRTPTHQAAMWAGREAWVSAFPGGIDPDERQLTGRRVGLVGFGGIGQRLAELLAPFACDVAIHDPYLPDTIAERFGVRNVSVDDLVEHAEILVLCAAANPGSRHVIEAKHIEKLRPRSILVNVARASLVDGDALRARLIRGDLYAALDVFDREPLPADAPLRSLPNVYLTPHRAGGIRESVVRLLEYLTDDLCAFARGTDRRHALTDAMIPSLDA
jgi:phosphoglycerate dehydrogenase-like enzyme